jgi:hypothetical protein
LKIVEATAIGDGGRRGEGREVLGEGEEGRGKEGEGERGKCMGGGGNLRGRRAGREKVGRLKFSEYPF